MCSYCILSNFWRPPNFEDCETIYFAERRTSRFFDRASRRRRAEEQERTELLLFPFSLSLSLPFPPPPSPPPTHRPFHLILSLFSPPPFPSLPLLAQFTSWGWMKRIVRRWKTKMKYEYWNKKIKKVGGGGSGWEGCLTTAGCLNLFSAVSPCVYESLSSESSTCCWRVLGIYRCDEFMMLRTKNRERRCFLALFSPCSLHPSFASRRCPCCTFC